MIEMTLITNSTAVEAAGYDAANRVLRVQMAGGKVFDYKDVPPDELNKLLLSPSPGRYLSTAIKPRYVVEQHEPQDSQSTTEEG